MLRLLKHRNFALLWCEGLVSNFGNWVLNISLPIFVFQLTDSVAATGGMYAAIGLPSLLFGSFAGVFVDRWDRRKTMVYVNLLQAVAVLPLLFLDSESDVWLVYVVAFLQTTLALFFGPAENALLPTVVEKNDLPQANSLNRLNNMIPRLAGPPLGGLIFAAYGLDVVTVIDSASFALAALLVVLVALPSAQRVANLSNAMSEAQNAFKRFWQEWVAGLRVVGSSVAVVLVFVTIGLSSIGDGPSGLFQVTFVSDVYGPDARLYGWLITAGGVGGIVGSLIVARIASRFTPYTLLVGGLLGTAACLIAMANIHVYAFTLTAMALIGITVSAWAVSATTILQTNVDDAYLGRVFSAYFAALETLALVGIALASAFGDELGPVAMLTCGGVVYALAGAVGYTLQRRYRIDDSASSTKAA